MLANCMHSAVSIVIENGSVYGNEQLTNVWSVAHALLLGFIPAPGLASQVLNKRDVSGFSDCQLSR